MPELPDWAVEYARTLFNIFAADVEIIKHSKKSLLIDNHNNCWETKHKHGEFDLRKGSFDPLFGWIVAFTSVDPLSKIDRQSCEHP